MVSDLVKTGKEIIDEDSMLHVQGFRTGVPNIKRLNELRNTKFLVLPSGLDVLEEMLKKEVLPGEQLSCTPEYLGVEVVKIISSVFARFKQDNGLVNTEGMKKEHGIKEE